MCKSSFSALISRSKTSLHWFQKPKSNLTSLRCVYIVLLLGAGMGVASSAPLPMPNSEINYPGASTTKAFVAKEPYVLNIQGTSTTISLGGASRSHDFSGTVPFVNPTTGKNDPFVFQAWSSGLVDWYGSQIKNTGVPGRIDKRTLGGNAVTMVKYNAGDDIAYEKCRSKLGGFPVPPRTHVRWELEVAFGNADGSNDWTLTPSGQSPVLFWQLKSNKNQTNPPLALNVDTDNLNSSKLMITVFKRVGTSSPIELGRVHGLSRNTLIPIVMEAFLDERADSNGGKGLWQVWVNNALAVEEVGPTLTLGPDTHEWSIETYLWNEPDPYRYNRATFYKTARMMVFPTDATAASADTTAPSAPSNLAATSPDSSKVYLSWSASTDNVRVAGYKIYRDNTAIGTSAVASFTDTSVIGGTTYNYTIKAYDDAGNFSASSNTATVKTPATSSSLSISSYYMSSINKWDATVNWTTNVPSSGVVYYGRSTSLGSSASYSTLSTSHSLKLAPLWDGYTYYYKIVAKNSSGATYTSPVSTFKTRW